MAVGGTRSVRPGLSFHEWSRKRLFPSLAVDAADDAGLHHVVMEHLRRYAEQQAAAENWSELDRVLRFVERAYERPGSPLENAVVVSFLEGFAFHRHEARVRALMGPTLVALYEDQIAYLEDLGYLGRLSDRTFRVLPGLPSRGNVVSFPPSLGRAGKEGVVVEFLPETMSAWIGNFAPGPGGKTAVVLHPNEEHVIVFAGGTGSIVDARERLVIGGLPGPVLDLRRLTNPRGFVCNNQGVGFFRVGPTRLEWHSRRLSVDGFRDLAWLEETITGAGLEVDGRTWTPFELDLRTGRTRGGPTVPQFDDWESRGSV